MSTSTSTMTAVTITGPGTGGVARVPVPEPGHGEIQVRVVLAGMCGTDTHLLSGHSFYLEHGFLRYPFVFGHEYTGVVSAIGPGVQHLSVGDRVVGHTMVPCHRCDNCQRSRPHLCRSLKEVGLRFIQGAAAEYISVPEFAVTVLPDSVSSEAAVLVEPSVSAYRAGLRLDLRAVDRVAVIGSGTLGLLALLYAKLVAGRVEVIGVAEGELALATELGADAVRHPDQLGDQRYTAVIEASGSPRGLQTAIDIADLGGRIAVVGLPPNPVAVDQTALALKDLTVHGVLHGLDCYQDVVALLAAGAVDPTPLIARIVTPDQAVAALSGQGTDPATRRAPKTLVRFAADA
ncbi:zinc-dependent alcohol dehydrogenase [Nakamurella leprariae]|uniref:Alcohol dehydrogenase catalytic domain-containing protein n=1 Tax=Nakamurella leprariae TaxID=2803911 RepID=A0A939BZL6_9ACTN|nr:alcohol dehydrogenase catalytic domain-containing protein [Nakamurella leprariae]MBM9467831.1 alcohol dehydrogenase catalytic domain-containing protein [Nakamurella leprariae]